MQADRPKQYLRLAGSSVLEQTLHRLISHPDIAKIVLAVSPGDSYIEHLDVTKNDWLELVQGGAERSDTVLCGLKSVEDDWVLVHDAARPCVRHSDISRLLTLAEGNTGGILARQATDTMKQAAPIVCGPEKHISCSIDRSVIWHALTPQFFPTQQLREALIWCSENDKKITDEASAVELTGGRAYLVPGEPDNIKITHPGDLALAEFFLKQQAANT